MQGGQPAERGLDVAQETAGVPVGRALEARSQLPQPILELLNRLLAVIAERNRGEADIGGEGKPVMDSIELRSRRPAGRPGAQDELAGGAAKQLATAVSAWPPSAAISESGWRRLGYRAVVRESQEGYLGVFDQRSCSTFTCRVRMPASGVQGTRP